MPGQGTPQSHIPISLSGPLQGRPGRSDFLLQGRPPGQQAFQGTELHLLICAHPQTNLSKIEGVPCLRNSAFRLRCCKAPLREAARRKRSKTKIKSCLRHGSNSSQAIAGGEGPATMTSQPSPGPKIATTTCKKNILPACPAHYLARPPLNTTGREIASLKIAHRWHEPPYALQTPGFAPSTQIVSASAHPSLPFKHRAFALPLALALAWTAACLSANTATRSSFDNCFAFCLILCLFRCSFFNC